MSIQDDIAALAPTALVEMFEIDLTPFSGPLLRFHAGTNALAGSLVWQGNTYEPYPVQATEFEWNGKGTLPRPKLAVANVTGLVSGYILDYQDLLGAKVTRRRTLAKYLDAVNFPGGVNASADPGQQLPDEIYSIDRKSAENKTIVQFELAAAFDVIGVQLPRRQIIQNLCAWKYKGTECGWSPDPTLGPFFDATDASTSDPAADVCGKRLSSCKCRFNNGTTGENPLPYGGFPAAGLVVL